MPRADFRAVIRTLAACGVEFVIVGGVAAVLNGAPVNTFDLDIVSARSEANIQNLLRALESLDAVDRMQPERRIKPNASHLSSPAHHNLITNQGALDIPGTIGRGLNYDELLPHTAEWRLRGSSRPGSRFEDPHRAEGRARRRTGLSRARDSSPNAEASKQLNHPLKLGNPAHLDTWSRLAAPPTH